MRDYGRFDAFLDRLVGDLYPDKGGFPAETITQDAIHRLEQMGIVKPGAVVLDIGCGKGVATAMFLSRGCDVVPVDAADRGAINNVRVVEADQSFMECPDGVHDLIWARHVLEHSPIPYFTLTEYVRVLKPGGWAYIEVPAPDTEAKHETNVNHYSVMGKAMWLDLMLRAGFCKVESQYWTYKFAVPQGDGSEINDLYFAFLLRKPDGRPATD